MAFLIEKDESSAGRRFVPFRLFASNGTAPYTGGSNNTMLASLNGAAQISIGSVSVVSANAGMYGMQLTASNVSVLGSLALYTDNVANYPQHVATVQVVNNNPMSIQSGVVIAGGSYSSTTVRLDLVAYSGATVGAGNFAPGVYSGVSFSIRDSGIATSSFQLGNYSGVSVEVKTKGIAQNSIVSTNYSGVSFEILTGGIQTTSIGKGLYSGVTVEINNIAPNTYSGVTIQGHTNYANISNVTLAVGTHSGATIQGILDPSQIWNASRSSYTAVIGFGAASQVVSVSTAQGGTVSTITLNSAETTTDSFYNGALLMIQYADGSRAGAIISSYSGSNRSALFLNALPVAVPSGATYVIYPGTDASIGLSVWSSYLTRSLSASGERSLASSIMSTNMGGTVPRLFQQGYELLRNRVQISGSTMTVYRGDDTTSSWTATISTGTATVYGVTPGIA
jgi:hypothetical protein